MTIAENIQHLKQELPDNVKLLAVSKTHPDAFIMEAYRAGQRIFGENKVQELVAKHERLPKDIQWHMIGHLQRNKVKYIAPFVSLIHSVDSLRLLKTIDKEGQKNNRQIKCLLEMHVAKEDSKFGLSENSLRDILESTEYQELEFVKIAGLMGMATYTDDKEQIKQEFDKLKAYFEQTKTTYFSGNDQFKELSMGMSGDYLLAAEAGSTIVRIGSLIFGARNYTKA